MSPSGSAAAARHQAEAILHESRFRGSSVPRPLHGLLAAIGAGLADPARALGRAVDHLARHLPGGRPTAWTLLAIVLALVVALLARQIGHHRLRRTSARAGSAVTTGDRPPTAAALLDQAERAEREGRLEAALRLRFAAGLAALTDRVRSPSTLPSGELSRRLGSQDFDALSGRFDEVVYGGQPARSVDVDDARSRWPHVLDAGPSR